MPTYLFAGIVGVSLIIDHMAGVWWRKRGYNLHRLYASRAIAKDLQKQRGKTK